MSSLSLEVCKPRTMNLLGIWDENLAQRFAARQEVDVQRTWFIGSLPILESGQASITTLFPWLLKMQVEKLLHSIVILFTSQPKIGRRKWALFWAFHFLLPDWIIFLWVLKWYYFIFEAIRAYVPYRKASYVVWFEESKGRLNCTKLFFHWSCCIS